jgi:L-ribulose-5-phosphate 3-epimerase
MSESSGLRFGYGTNGFANHRLTDALDVVAELGYVGVALTLDHAHVDPFAPDLDRQVKAVARELRRRRLSVVVETGARYLLDPRRKHAPTLLDDDPRRLYGLIW